jgi:hypothetical protein
MKLLREFHLYLCDVIAAKAWLLFIILASPELFNACVAEIENTRIPVVEPNMEKNHD